MFLSHRCVSATRVNAALLLHLQLLQQGAVNATTMLGVSALIDKLSTPAVAHLYVYRLIHLLHPSLHAVLHSSILS